MTSKRARASGSTSQPMVPAIERDEDFPDVIFCNEDQRQKFQHLKGRIVSSKWIDRSALERLGILEPTRDLFASLGLSTLFNACHNTHEHLTLEFVSSLWEDVSDRSKPKLRFRLHNRNFSLTISQLAKCFGLPTGGDLRIPQGGEACELFRRLTGLTNVNTSHMHINQVHHPCVRVCLKFFSTCLFGRADPHSARSLDLNILAKYFLAGQTDININIPVFLWKHLLSISRHALSSSQDVVIGGLVTRIATKFKIPDDAVVLADFLLSLQHLCQCGYLVEGSQGGFRWKIHSRPPFYIDMPTEDLPSLEPNRAHYLFPAAFPAESSGARTGPPLGPSPVAPQGYSPFEQLMIDNFNVMQLSQQQMAAQLTSLDTRFTHFELQSQAAFRPLLDYHHQQGHFHADVQYPDWYSPPPTYQDDDDDDEQQDNDFDPMG